MYLYFVEFSSHSNHKVLHIRSEERYSNFTFQSGWDILQEKVVHTLLIKKKLFIYYFNIKILLFLIKYKHLISLIVILISLINKFFILTTRGQAVLIERNNWTSLMFPFITSLQSMEA